MTDQLVRIRKVLAAYPDSDLASLAETLTKQRLLLARAVVTLARCEGVDVDEMGLTAAVRLAEEIVATAQERAAVEGEGRDG